MTTMYNHQIRLFLSRQIVSCPTFGFGVFLILTFASAIVSAQAVSGCGNLSGPGQYGPYDYRKDIDKLPIVLTRHFTPEVEALLSGSTGKTPGPDIDYTLRAIPNNHRALIAMMRLGEKEKTPTPLGSHYSISCWFERAIVFTPNDSIVRMIYSTYLFKNNREVDAINQLEVAKTHAGDNPFTHFNIGLHYFDFKQYDKALTEAHRAMALGLDKPELRDKLMAIGKWSDYKTNKENSNKSSSLAE